MGKVYRVEDNASGETLALKLFGGRLARGSARSQLWFRREFHTMARLTHPVILRVFDYGIDEELGPYYTMEYLDGEDLRHKRLSAEETCRVLRDVASALAFLHARHLVHRDLAPGNVHRTSDGRTKLMDFGVLATVGVTGEVAGTPPFIAPESLRRMPIDQRVDLFGLGALAYKLLTGRQAFPARRLEDLEGIWRAPPPAPSSLVKEAIPEALDELVLALLSQDPLARPRSAVEVIDRLGAAAGLAPMTEVEEARGYLTSASMVGRQREMARLKRTIARAGQGRGQAVLIEALSGAGKSRLLREVGLEAQLAGAVVLNAGSEQAGRGPYGLLRELARQLIAAAPDDAVETARPRAGLIARIVPELRDGLERAAQAGPECTRTEREGGSSARRSRRARQNGTAADPAEERMRAQRELTAWFLAVSVRRTLVLLIDDMQRCDEASAAVLTALAHAAAAHRLLLVAALRTDDTVLAEAAVAALRDGSVRIKLRGLDETNVEALVKTLFGDVPHVRRLARWIHDLAGGVPLLCLELARHLVEARVVRFVDGMWVVPEQLATEGLPRGLAEAMDARIRGLSPRARALAETLSVHDGVIPLELCVATTTASRGDGARDEPAAEEEVFAALDELALNEVLVGSGRSYRFRHDQLREALLAGLDEDRRRQLHLLVGETLAAGEVAPEQEAEVGWHLLRGGEEIRGAELLRSAGERLYHAQSFRDAIGPLEAALEVFEREGRSPRECVELRHMLLMAGCMFDRRVALRYVDQTVQAFRSYAGVALAGRLGRFLGRHLALALGLGLAFIRWFLTPRRRRGPSPVAALRTLFVVVGYAATAYAVAYDIPKLRALLDLVRPLAIFTRRVPHAVYLLTCSLLDFPLGRLGTVRRNAARLLEILDTDRVTPISDIDRRTGEGGARYLLALMAVAEGDPRFLDQLEQLEELDLRFYEVGALQARLCYHRWRGEEETAARIQSEAEVMFVQLGSVWQMEAWLPVVSSHAFALTRDVLGLKNTIEVLERLCEEGYGFQPHLELARGEYHRERGELEASRAALERASALLFSGEGLIRPAVLSAMAETMLASGDVARAGELAREGIALGEDPERGQPVYRLRSARTLAMVEAESGQVDRAAARLDALIHEATSIGNPVTIGSMHEARARIALSQNDETNFLLHASKVDRWFRQTRNPVLIARSQALQSAWERSVEEVALSSDARAAAGGVDTQAQTNGSAILALITGCKGPEERAERALEVLIEASVANSGFLYLIRDNELRLVAPLIGEEPAPAVVDELWQAIEVSSELVEVDDATSDAVTIEVAQMLPARWDSGPQRWIPLVLTLGHSRVVGAAAVVSGVDGAGPRRPDPAVVAQVARGLYEAGDVTCEQR
jgi:hypothetical protein